MENSERDGNIRTPDLPLEKPVCRSRSNGLELNVEQLTGLKLGKEYVKDALLPCLINLHAEYIMGNARLDDSQAGIKIVGRNINNLRYAHQFSSVAQSCLTLCDPMDCSTPGFPVHHQLP